MKSPPQKAVGYRHPGPGYEAKTEPTVMGELGSPGSGTVVTAGKGRAGTTFADRKWA